MTIPVGSVAVLSDIHGVLPVLDAVLAQPEVQAADLIVVCGDHAAGPQPVQVLDRLTALPNVVLVRGNADRDLVALARGEYPPDEEAYPVDAWAAAQLSPAHVDLLAGLPHPAVLDVRGFGPVAFCHGTPRDDNEVVLVDTRLERWAEAFAGLPDEVRTVVCGHTHMPFTRLVDRRLVINPGSIGMPYGRPGGHWALLKDGGVSLRSVEIDVDAAIAAVVAGSAYPDRAAWAEDYLRATASDADAIAAFGPRDGRLAASKSLGYTAAAIWLKGHQFPQTREFGSRRMALRPLASRQFARRRRNRHIDQIPHTPHLWTLGSYQFNDHAALRAWNVNAMAGGC